MKQHYSTTLDKELIKKLKMQAIKEECKANEIITKALNEYLKKN